ncbi:Ribosomal protein S16 [Ceratobasidium theobromae]|uniref:Ribosomal protein S16 n=1 Tax=Ceratobasidium theobromae TaxID=1582974 RepID=A0A5N5QW56_9AGAM|nr:Ribosomal protein S16 [Ceratobasidium theobromae]
MSVVRLRLACHGQRNRPFYHIVAINVRKARDAEPLEKLGEYDPIPKPRPEDPNIIEKRITWNADRVKYWIGVGAQPSPMVARLLEMVSRLASFDYLRNQLENQANLIPEDKAFKGTKKFRQLKSGAGPTPDGTPAS